MAFSSQLLRHSLWSKQELSNYQSIPLLRANHQPVKKQSQRKLELEGIKRKCNRSITLSMFNPYNGTSSFSPSDTIKTFYTSINKKDLNQLALLISEDCFFDDFSFIEPFRGRKETMKFLEELTTCMGNNTEFYIEKIYEGVDLTTVVNWHLEWKKKKVPFSRGCSCYEFSRDSEQLVIKKAQVIIESPIKLGSIALELFQMVISVFDAFPEAVEWLFLMRPQLLITIYNIALRPSLGPILAWYRNLWNIMVTSLRIIFKLFKLIIDINRK